MILHWDTFFVLTNRNFFIKSCSLLLAKASSYSSLQLNAVPQMAFRLLTKKYLDHKEVFLQQLRKSINSFLLFIYYPLINNFRCTLASPVTLGVPVTCSRFSMIHWTKWSHAHSTWQQYTHVKRQLVAGCGNVRWRFVCFISVECRSVEREMDETIWYWDCQKWYKRASFLYALVYCMRGIIKVVYLSLEDKLNKIGKCSSLFIIF